MSAVFIYSTTANRAEAERIGQMVMEERLAACVNINGLQIRTTLSVRRSAILSDSPPWRIVKFV